MAGPQRMSGRLGDLSSPSPDPLISYSLRSLQSAVATSFFVVLLVAIYLELPGVQITNRTACSILLMLAAAVTAVAFLLPWRRILVHPRGPVLVWAWAMTMIILVELGIAFTGGGQSQLFIALLVTTAFLAGPLFPVPVEIGLSTLAVAGYVITVLAVGRNVSVATLVFRATVMAGVAGGIGLLANEVTRGLRRQIDERIASEKREQLWRTVAALVRQIDVPVIDEVLAAVVDALVTVGFDSADICEVDIAAGTFRVLHARGIPESYTAEVHDLSHGAAARVLERRAVVVLDDYRSTGEIPEIRGGGYGTVIAGPVWVDGALDAILMAGSRVRLGIGSEEIAAFETLAAQAGHALENARLLEQHRTDVDELRELLESSPDAMIVVDANGVLLRVSRQAEALYGYRADELVGRSAAILAPQRVWSDQLSMVDRWLSRAGNDLIGLDHMVLGLCKDGTEKPIEIRLSTVETRDGTVIAATVRDVTERREFERRLAHQATHDSFTGLPNREFFLQQLTQALEDHLSTDPPLAVCFLDLDHFKYVNDSRGHGAGDALVAAVAERISRFAGEQFVARVGGDEFGLLVTGLAGRLEVVEFTTGLQALFDEAFLVEGVGSYVTASVGIAFGGSFDQADEVMRNANAAVHMAKQKGRNRTEFFDEELTVQAALRVATEAELHLALERDEFELAYQPVVSLEDQHVVGMEALLRWQNPTRGEVDPEQFIEIAEDTGLIVPIGLRVLEMACFQFAEWRHRYRSLPDITVAVNVSSRQLEHDHFVTDVAGVLERTGIPPRLLTLEITESFFMRDFQAAVRRLHALKDLGVRLAIDDFGTGFSSLFSLSRLPVDAVKIDKAFIDGIGTRYDAVVAAVVALGRAFDLQVVAEGIEEEGQRDRLIDLGCHFAQGFYFSKPLDILAVESLLQPLNAD